MLVVDASVIVDILAARPHASFLHARLFRDDETLHAPHLIDAEVLSGLRRLVLGGLVAANLVDDAIRAYLQVRITRHPHDVLMERAWQLRQNLTAYDAIYVTLAEALRAPFITLDARLAKAAPSTVRVELIA